MTCKDCDFGTICNIGDFEIDTEVEKHCKVFKPKADFVEVVRCEDCKRWSKNSNLPTDTSGLCFYHHIDTDEKDFCSYGERKINNG